jgi:hypothetical protein
MALFLPASGKMGSSFDEKLFWFRSLKNQLDKKELYQWIFFIYSTCYMPGIQATEMGDRRYNSRKIEKC